MILRFQHTLGCLLSATVACAALLPPAVGHVHAGGDRAHVHSAAWDADEHAAFHAHHGEHAEHHEHATLHEHGPADAHRLHAAGEWHAHLCFFGLSLTLPLPADGEFPGADDDDQRVVFLGPQTSEDPGLTTRDAGDDVALDCVRTASESSLDALRDRATGSAPVESPPLCDTARHARSGVQLA